ncbi:sortase [Ruminococcaceae bacterium OttesenSCG-928-L11]|nr:sortase [Ruminococcaceae bacterium OttesenSCG-928-L11]
MKTGAGKKAIRIVLGVVLAGSLLWLAMLLWEGYGPRPVAPPPEVSSQEETQSKTEATTEPEPQSQPETEPESQPVTEPELHTQLYEVGKFGPDAERKTYESGTMTLSVPRMNYEGPVLDGTTKEVLDIGPGLFEQAQLPGPENRNVSIAAHRDIKGMEFYDIDKIIPGDPIILTYLGKRYTYEAVDSFVTTDDDWDPIRTKNYSCVTLQSCTPINVASHRIFVVGRLVKIEEVEELITAE